MPTSILTTKLYIPQPRPELVPRPRLLQKLNDSLTPQHRLTLVSAPAGFGKTTLISHWVTQSNETLTKTDESILHHSSLITHPSQVAWLALEESDNDLGRFLTYVIAALQQTESNIGQTVQSALKAAQLPPVESLLTALINEIVALDRQIILVLDDYHAIENDEIHDALNFLLEHLPPQMYIVMTTRVDPPLPLSRWRVRGQITEIRAAELRFNIEEMVTFLSERMGLNLSPDDLRVLEERTEGWIAGLQLAALSMQRVQDVSTFIKTFAGSHHYVVEYLVDEVLNQQPEEIRSFLLKTSILERLSWPLCDVIMATIDSNIDEEISPPTSTQTPSPASLSPTSQPPHLPISPSPNLQSPVSSLQPPTSSQNILNYLVQANLFIIPLDNERRWFRYHQLFAQVLHNRLQHTVEAQEIAQLRLQASSWCEQNNFIGEAIQYALAAGEVDRAAQLIEVQARPLMMRGQISTIRRWLSNLSDTQIAVHPRLGLLDALLRLVSSDYAKLITRVQAVEQTLVQQQSILPPEIFKEMQAELLAYDAIVLIIQNKSAEAISRLQKALRDVREDNLYLQGLISLMLSGALFSGGQEQEALPLLRRSIELSEMAGNTFFVLLGIARLAQFQTLRGELRAAEMLCREAIQLASQEDNQHSPGVSFAYDGLGEIYWEWNQLEKSVEYLELAIKLSDVGGIRVSSILNRLHLAIVLQYRGRPERAVQLLAEAEEITEEITYPFAKHILNILKIRLLLAQDRLVEAIDLAKMLQKNTTTNDPTIIVETIWAVMARVLIAQARLQPKDEILNFLDEAFDLLAKLIEQAEVVGRLSYLIEALVLQAMTYQLVGDTEQAVSALARAIELGQPEDYCRVFVNEGRPMAELLDQLLAKDSTHETYIKNLLAIIAAEAIQLKPKLPVTFERTAVASLVEPLSERELEVLRLVAAGSSNRQIAKALIIASGTVKKHLSNIFGKLNAESRTQAVARARELGLLE